jgi:hypothetical protein
LFRQSSERLRGETIAHIEGTTHCIVSMSAAATRSPTHRNPP